MVPQKMFEASAIEIQLAGRLSTNGARACFDLKYSLTMVGLRDLVKPENR
jgi:hypothetical protein